MVDHLRLVTPAGSRPFLEQNLSPTQETRKLLNGLVNLDPLTGDGSPEGVHAAKSRRLYIDLTNTRTGGYLYIKVLDAISDDPTKGWELASDAGGNAASNEFKTANYQVLLGNRNIACSGTFTVTLIDAADATGQEITINSISGTITVAADATIQGSASLTTGTTGSWFFANGQWYSK